MNGVIETVNGKTSTTTGSGETGNSTAEITTLYDLMASMQDQAPRQEQDAIVPTVFSWLQSGRVKFLRQPSHVLHRYT